MEVVLELCWLCDLPTDGVRCEHCDRGCRVPKCVLCDKAFTRRHGCNVYQCFEPHGEYPAG